MTAFSDLLGKTLTEIEIDRDNNEIFFATSSGEKYKIRHYQDCCEMVYIEDICGDLKDLIGSPLLEAEKVTNRDNPPKSHDEEWLWTFYKLATIKGSVTIRWYGESNGYYSEEVDFIKLRNKQ